jgi:hypothetical protein
MRYQEWFQRTNKKDLEILYKALKRGVLALDESEVNSVIKLFSKRPKIAQLFFEEAENQVSEL